MDTNAVRGQKTNMPTSGTGQKTPTSDQIAFYYIVASGLSIVLIVGTVGNILTFVVVLSKRLGYFPTRPFLVALAVADLTVLYSSATKFWLRVLINYDFSTSHWFICKLQYFLAYSSRITSSWLIVSVTVDRLICVVFPPISNRITQKHRIVSSIAICILSFLVNLHMWGIIGIIYNGDCEVFSGHEGYNLADFFLFSLFPSLAICVCNTVVVVVIKRHKRVIARRDANEEIKASINNKLTVLSFLISATFVLTTMPPSIFMIIYHYVDITGMSGYYTLFAVMIILNYSNHSINFFLYCFSGMFFQKILLDIIKRRPSVWQKNIGQSTPPESNPAITDATEEQP